jgi:hypothetical protein
MDADMKQFIDEARLKLENRGGGEYLALTESEGGIDLMVYQMEDLSDLVAIRLEVAEVDALVDTLMNWREENA